ncbi:SF1B family DNA helicase RecD2 [Philodulcilactobacillus myokoensis]|nr:ATP-dependent RecD-like DNA helicase [Philodulcilactobacillus myokoensis]
MNLFSEPQNNDQNEQKYVVGKPTTTFFQANDSFYKVLLVQVDDQNFDWSEDTIVVTGNFGELNPDSTYRFNGKLIDHPKYGRQFKASNYRNEINHSKKGLVNYLSGSNFPGIGKKIAQRVVDNLGNNLVEVILNQPDSLKEKEIGLTDKQQKTLVNGIKKNNGTAQTIIGLNSYGFGSSLSAAIFKKYGNDTLKIIQENPYKLVEDINGISFKRADRMAREMGLRVNSTGRLKAGLLAALKQLSVQNGDTYTTTRSLLDKSLSLLNDGIETSVDPDGLAKALIQLARERKVICDENRIYLKQLYYSEWQIAENIKRIMDHSKHQKFAPKNIKREIKQIERDLQINYDQSQVDALTKAVQSKIFILTGGPGTGKTTIINGLVHLFANLNGYSLDIKTYDADHPYPILLAAPTGRAAKKMSESTNIPASTIHRLLGLNSYDDNNDDSINDLEGGLLIIDEMSMVDTSLFKILIQAVPNDMKVILVGDKDQLPSVGPGQIFSDLLSSKMIPKIELNTIYRQNDHSTIIPLAHAIKNGQLPSDFTTNKSDRSFIPCNAYQVGSVINQIVVKAKKKGFSASDIQVLAPIYRGISGINRLNSIVQNIMNPKDRHEQEEIPFRGIKFRMHDKVLQLVNDAENDIFNGDIGKIIGMQINDDRQKMKDKLTVSFGDKEVEYDRKNWDQLTLAYCTSIHKAQGSEFDMVILPMLPQYHIMLKRNLLYTAITRASKMLIMLGDYQSFEQCVENASVNRKTTLKKRIIDIMGGQKDHDSDSSKKLDLKLKKPKKHQLTNELIQSNQIDPMIGMHGVTPQQFMS